MCPPTSTGSNELLQCKQLQPNELICCVNDDAVVQNQPEKKQIVFENGPGIGSPGRRHARTRGGVVALAITMLATACASANYVSAPTQDRPRPTLPANSVTNHVILISLDGLRPDAIGRFPTPTLERLMQEGSYTLTASTIVPSKTLPSHTSMLTSEPPEEHGVLWNEAFGAPNTTIAIPTVFSAARAAGYTTAAFFSKPKFRYLQAPGTLDYSQAPGGLWGRWSNEQTAQDVEAYLAKARPNLLFVHLPDPDHTGHRDGWMSEAYGLAATAADAAVARILGAADRAYGPQNYTVIVTSDHGGHGRGHGTADPRDTTIPWIAWGSGVRAGSRVHSPVRTLDTAPTILSLLGVPAPETWNGTPVLEAFEHAATTAAP